MLHILRPNPSRRTTSCSSSHINLVVTCRLMFLVSRRRTPTTGMQLISMFQAQLCLAFALGNAVVWFHIADAFITQTSGIGIGRRHPLTTIWPAKFTSVSAN